MLNPPIKWKMTPYLNLTGYRCIHVKWRFIPGWWKIDLDKGRGFLTQFFSQSFHVATPSDSDESIARVMGKWFDQNEEIHFFKQGGNDG